MKLKLIALAAFAGDAISCAHADVPQVQYVTTCGAASFAAGQIGPLQATTTGQLCTSGTFSATISGFQPTPAYASLSVGAASSRVALPTGSSVIVYNTGSNAAYVRLGDVTVTATTGNDVIQPGSWLAFTVGSATYLAGIETAGTTSLNISGGAGLPTGAGGGSGGSSSNASVGSTGAAVPASATYVGITSGGNLTGWTGAVTANAGTNLNTANIESYTSRLLSGALPVAHGTATATTGQAVGGTYNATPPTFLDTQQGAIQLNSHGAVITDGSAVTQPVSGTVTVTPKTGALTIAGCTVGVTSAQCLAGSTATNHVQIQNVSASATVSCSWGGTAIANNSGSFMLAAGASALWGPTTGGIPTVALNCIASSAGTPLYLEYN